MQVFHHSLDTNNILITPWIQTTLVYVYLSYCGFNRIKSSYMRGDNVHTFLNGRQLRSVATQVTSSRNNDILSMAQSLWMAFTRIQHHFFEQNV